ncbi:MAG: prepilin-type N-terminal cleavage/methylation domain-containing protein [Phycisphaerales bacterium]
MCHPRPLHGFTLVELLVVVAIIALLIAILLPSLTKAREMAKGLACMTQERQMGVGLSSYAGDNGGYYPAISNPNGPGYDRNTWMYAIWTYVGYSPASYVQTVEFSRSAQMYGAKLDANDIFYCPVSRVLRRATPTPANCTINSDYAYGMNGTPTIWSLGTANQWIAWDPANPTSSGGYWQSIYLPQRSEQRVRQPAATDLTIDCAQAGTGYFWKWPQWGNGAPGGVIPHLGGANATYFDLHGQWLSDADIPLCIGGPFDTTPTFWKGQ